MSTSANQSSGPKAGGPHQFPIPTLLAARFGQFCVGLHVCRMKSYNFPAMNKSPWRWLLALLLLGLGGCGPKGTPATFSIISSEAGFNPETYFGERKYALKSSLNYGVYNPATHVRRHSWQGVATVSGSTNGCEAVAIAIRDALNKSLGGVCHDELTGAGIPNPMGKSGQLLYLKNGMQGEVHVWLFGSPAETSVSYAIFLHEERAR